MAVCRGGGGGWGGGGRGGRGRKRSLGGGEGGWARARLVGELYSKDVRTLYVPLLVTMQPYRRFTLFC